MLKTLLAYAQALRGRSSEIAPVAGLVLTGLGIAILTRHNGRLRDDVTGATGVLSEIDGEYRRTQDALQAAQRDLASIRRSVDDARQLHATLTAPKAYPADEDLAPLAAGTVE